MATTASTTVPAIANLTYLQESRPDANLEILSSPKYGTAPATSCLTRNTYRKVPYFKATPQAVHSRALGFGLFAAISSISARVIMGTIQQASMRSDDLQKNFFHVASTAFMNAVEVLNQPTSRLFTFLSLTAAAMSTVGICVVGRLLCRDSSHAARYKMLDIEYSKAAELLTKTYEAALSKNDPELLKGVREATLRLAMNIPMIRERLKTCAKLEPAEIDALILKLHVASNPILKGSE